jgi:ABC-type transport system substrate-binding protein
MMTTQKIRRIACAIATVTLSVSAITTPMPGYAQTGKPKTLRLGLTLGFDRIDPLASGFLGNAAALMFTFEGLTGVNTTGRVVPAAAESWSSNATFTEFVFNVRPGLKYSDGTPLNAKRFEYAILRYVDPAMKGFETRPYYVIGGVEEWTSAWAALDAEKDTAKKKPLMDALASAKATARESVRALDRDGTPCAGYAQADCLTLRVRLNKSQVELPYLFSSLAIAPVKEELVAKNTDWWKRTANWVGNGPYKLTGVTIRAAKSFGNTGTFQYAPNRAYRGRVPTNNLTLAINSAADTLIRDYTNGKLDMLSVVAGPTWAEQTAKVPRAEIVQNPSSCKIALSFRTINKPFNDIKVRQAFSAAFDRAGFAKREFWGPMIVDTTWLPQGMPGAIVDDTRNTFNPDTARKLIAESSYKTIEALPPIIIPHLSSDIEPTDKPMQEFIGTQLSASLPGLKVIYKEIKSIDDYYATRDNPASPENLWLINWCGARPVDLLGDYFATGKRGWLNARWSNEKFDAIAAKMALEPDFEKSSALAREANNILVEETPYLFIGTMRNIVLIKPNVIVGQASLSDVWVGDLDEAGWSLK